MSATLAPPRNAEATLVRDRAIEAELDLLFDPAAATPIHYWAHECWACTSMNTVWWALATAPWSWDRIEADPLVIAQVLSAAGSTPLADIGPVVTEQAGDYTGFRCASCAAVLGDYYVHSEFLERLAAGTTSVVSVRI